MLCSFFLFDVADKGTFNRDLKLEIDAVTHTEMVEVQRNNAFLRRPNTNQGRLNSRAVEYLRHTSPPLEPSLLLRSPPLFPRSLRLGCGQDKSIHPGPTNLADISGELRPVSIEAAELSIADENMVVVGGWSQFPHSTRRIRV